MQLHLKAQEMSTGRSRGPLNFPSVPVQTFELTETAVDLVLKESKESCKEAVAYIKGLRNAYPEVDWLS